MIDAVPARLKLAEEAMPGRVKAINFKEVSNIPAKIWEMYPGGLDWCALPPLCPTPLFRANTYAALSCIDAGTFHEPKTLLHKVEKTLMLETDVSETANEMIMATRKMGR